MASSPLPKVVIVTGSFASTRLYDVFTEYLQKQNIRSTVVGLPSVGRREGKPPATMSEDTETIIAAVEPLLEAGERVVLMTHSYGGIPGTQSLQRLSKKSREAQGKTGGIESIIYMAAVVLPVNISNLEALGEIVPDGFKVDDDYMAIDLEQVAGLTFSDMPSEDVPKLAETMDRFHSTPSFKEKLTYPGYNDVDVTYIYCGADKVIPPEQQHFMIDMIKGTTGRDVNVVELPDVGHAPVASIPDQLSKVVLDILQKK